MESIKGRFAPSPTGRMHLGNAFCALLAWLSARSQGGSLLLRMEDLDPQRSRESYARVLMEDSTFARSAQSFKSLSIFPIDFINASLPFDAIKVAVLLILSTDCRSFPSNKPSISITQKALILSNRQRLYIISISSFPPTSIIEIPSAPNGISRLYCNMLKNC